MRMSTASESYLTIVFKLISTSFRFITTFTWLLQITLNLVGVLTSVAIICPYIIIPTLVLLVLFSFLWNIYIRTARDIKRLEGT